MASNYIPQPGLIGSVTSQGRVLGALILRELHIRYGRENIGHLWLFVEPMILATVVTLAHTSQANHYGNDIQPAPFAIIGYTLFIIFRNTFNRAEGAIESSHPLFYHRMVTVQDLLFARIIMEVVGCIGTSLLLLGLAVGFGVAQPPVRPLELLSAIGLMSWWSASLTLVAASVTYRSEVLGRQLHVISYLSIPISGAWFQLSWVPLGIRDKLQWFPMPLIFEQARHGQFKSASAQFVCPGYVVAWCAGLTYLGLLLSRRVRNRIHA